MAHPEVPAAPPPRGDATGGPAEPVPRWPGHRTTAFLRGLLMNEEQTLAYVKASGVALGLPLDAARAARVAAHLQRTAALAQLLEQFPLAPEDELAEIYCPDWPHVPVNKT